MKKGFTLIELLAVMVIVGIITLITVPTVLHVIKNARESSINELEKSIKTAMQLWLTDNPSYYPKRNRKFYLTVSQLKHEGYLDDELINPLTDEYVANDLVLKVENNNGSYEYSFDLYGGTKTGEYNGVTPYIELVGGIKQIVDEGTNYQYATAYAYNSLGEEVNTLITPRILDTYRINNVIKEVYVLYTASISDIPVSLVETITINSSKKICINNTHNDLYTVGDTYTCDFDDGVLRTFYLIASNEDEVKMIMDKNIGGNTTWNDNISLEQGPVTANAYLKMLTRNWDVQVELPDANGLALAASNGNYDNAQLLDYMYDNLDCNMLECSENGETGTTLGYWTSTPFDNTYAYGVNALGKVTKTTINTAYGVRPVIVIPKDKINN